ncbi:MAG: Phosphoenolpyruvate-protein phosphotransferase [candidate division BRC1 bacterium ADurb.BinA364]|nr:MAG: Phosphoenolpyruvate-protein phosphotransferase [candidate division BRC1 bacterium ADurb.BinA364]
MVGVGNIAGEIGPGEPLIIDGLTGKIIVNPTREEIERYRRLRREWRARFSALGRLRTLPCETRDGYLIDLSANIELPHEVPQVLAHGADGIGLFRTEFLYLSQDQLPTEEEQFKVYRSVLSRLNPRSVIFRTMDLGGDKFMSQITLSRELNPFLGLRGIRLCLQYPEIFKTQLRAILRASHYGKARIMFPMITGLSEVRQSKAILEEVKQELVAEGQPFDGGLEVGIMIEVPSAALSAEALAKEVDFFSIGTNDLIQYTMAVDRVNEHVAHLYDPHHPSVLRLIREVAECAHKHGIWAGLCGEMASDPDLASLLAGMGIDELSMASSAIPQVKQRIRQVSIADLQELARDALALSTSEEVRDMMAENIPAIVHIRKRR